MRYSLSVILLLTVGPLLSAVGSTAHLYGAFPLLVTPYTAEAKLDVDTLVHEAEYVDCNGARGIIWPTAGEINDLDALGEYEQGLTALAQRWRKGGVTARLTAVCCGTNSAMALKRAALWEKTAKAHGLETAILARPPDDAKDDADMRRYYRALAATVSQPVIIQTYNGKSPQPSVELLIELAKEFPLVYGHVKEESPGDKVNGRVAQLVAAKPVIKGVFSGWGAQGFLYQGPRLGTIGCITQRPAYTRLLARMLALAAEGRDASDAELGATYGKFLIMTNLGANFPTKNHGGDMRGPHLMVLKRLGVFPNTYNRHRVKGKWVAEEYVLSPREMAEIDARIAYALGR